MRTCKVYFKILKKEVPVLLICLAAFFLASGVSLWSGGKKQEPASGRARLKIAWYSEDGENEFLAQFRSWLGESWEVTQYGSRGPFERESEYGLFYESLTAALVIPQGFTEALFSGGKPELRLRSAAGRGEARPLELSINRFLALSADYGAGTGLGREQAARRAGEELRRTSELFIYAGGGAMDKQAGYASGMGLGLLAVLVIGTGVPMLVWKQRPLRNRNLVSPESSGLIHIQLVLGNLAFGAGVWAFLFGAMLLFLPKTPLDWRFVLLLLNSFVFTLCALSIGFLTGTLLRGKKAVYAAAGGCAAVLGLLGGVFFPVSRMGSGFAWISRFFPVFWFVEANNRIGELTDPFGGGFSLIIRCMLIQIGFALAVCAFSLAWGKQKNQKAGI